MITFYPPPTLGAPFWILKFGIPASPHPPPLRPNLNLQKYTNVTPRECHQEQAYLQASLLLRTLPSVQKENSPAPLTAVNYVLAHLSSFGWEVKLIAGFIGPATVPAHSRWSNWSTQHRATPQQPRGLQDFRKCQLLILCFLTKEPGFKCVTGYFLQLQVPSDCIFSQARVNEVECAQTRESSQRIATSRSSSEIDL